MTLQGKSAFITGSTSGIGLGIAEQMAAQGANIMLNGFGDATEIEKIRSDMARKYQVKVLYSDADVTNPEALKASVTVMDNEWQGCDILVNNAGIQHVSSVEDFPVGRWQAIINVNLSAVFYGCQAVLPGMKQRGWGRIINIASVHGLVASVDKSAYVAAKHGVVGLTKVLALETAETAVTCNAICPGWVLTPLVEKQVQARADQKSITFDEAKIDLLSEKQPSKQFVTPAQLGDMAVFLCSESASQIRGQAMAMDGAWTAC